MSTFAPDRARITPRRPRSTRRPPTISTVASRVCTAVAGILCGGLLAAAALAADQTVVGKQLIVKNPNAADPGRRKVIASAKERGSTNTIVGDPTLAGSAGGAVLEIVANGANPTAQVFLLPQGTASTGKPLWRGDASQGYRYKDRRGEQGPVKAVRIRKTPAGTFQIKATVLGENGPLVVVPPNTGTDGFLTLSLGGGDRYCVQYGPEGKSTDSADRLWRIKQVTVEGCSPSLTSGGFLALSYNVAGLPDALSGSNPEVNTPLISPLLNGYDLVVVQESWLTPDPNPLAPLRTYHEVLAADAAHPYESVPLPAPLNTDPDRPEAILSDGLNRFSRFPFEPVIRERWEECFASSADCLALKGFSVARTTFAPGVVADVYNLHMEAGGDPEDEQLRDDAVTQLAAFMNAFSVGRAVIVGGDFNLHTDEEPDSTQFQRLLTETGLADVCATLSCPEPDRIDKFLFRSSDSVVITPTSWSFETDVFIRGDGEPLSDHDALAVRFEWSVE